MKKLVAGFLVVLFVLMAIAPAASAANAEKGGFLGFIVGCCFGVRSGAAYNDGKDLHWREWGTLIPIFNWVVGIMNGIDGMNGLTTKDMAAKYGATYY
jgi:hypothetical protein